MTKRGHRRLKHLAAVGLALGFPALAALSLSLARQQQGGFPLASAGGPPEERPSNALDRALALALERRRVMRALAAEVAEGRLSLREGAARARDHLAGEPRLAGVTTGLRVVARQPGATDEERCAASLLEHVRERPWPSAAEAEKLVARLRREMGADHGGGRGRPAGSVAAPPRKAPFPPSPPRQAQTVGGTTSGWARRGAEGGTSR